MPREPETTAKTIDRTRKSSDFPVGSRVGMLFDHGKRDPAAMWLVTGTLPDGRVKLLCGCGKPGCHIESSCEPSHLWMEVGNAA